MGQWLVGRGNPFFHEHSLLTTNNAFTKPTRAEFVIFSKGLIKTIGDRLRVKPQLLMQHQRGLSWQEEMPL